MFSNKQHYHNNQRANLHILSLAYASGRIDREKYLKLRSAQLSALEFNKRPPALPAELIDLPREFDSTASRGRQPVIIGLWSVIALVLIIVLLNIYFLWQKHQNVTQAIIPSMTEQVVINS